MARERDDSRRIWKYELDVVDVQDVEMPRDAEILSVQFQGPTLCVWAMVEPENNKRPHRFRIFGTGNALPPQPWGTYVATVQHPGKPWVWHVFQGN